MLFERTEGRRRLTPMLCRQRLCPGQEATTKQSFAVAMTPRVSVVIQDTGNEDRALEDNKFHSDTGHQTELMTCLPRGKVEKQRI